MHRQLPSDRERGDTQYGECTVGGHGPPLVDVYSKASRGNRIDVVRPNIHKLPRRVESTTMTAGRNNINAG